MEKKEAVREYCIERAITLLLSSKGQMRFGVEDVINTAKELEKYISSPLITSQVEL